MIHPLLAIDAQAEVDYLVRFIRETVVKKMHRYGVVVGISGGIDSSVCLALCARAFPSEKIVALMLPEKESDTESEHLARLLAQEYGVTPELHDITPVLEAYGCYQHRDAAIRRLFPEYDPQAGYRCKISLPTDPLESGMLNIFSLVIVNPAGEEFSRRLPPKEFLEIVAASNFKQRTRMCTLYHAAEQRNFAVIGTANKNEQDMGFFVKYGDGGIDLQPIVHLFKTQVYELARYLNVPELIQQRPPTTDTYSAHSTQQDFFFQLPFALLDVLWCALEQGLSLEETALLTELSTIQVQRAWTEIKQKCNNTEYLRMAPVKPVLQSRPTFAGVKST